MDIDQIAIKIGDVCAVSSNDNNKCDDEHADYHRLFAKTAIFNVVTLVENNM